MCQRVRQECGVQGTGPSTVLNQKGELAQIVSWVNEAYQSIQRLWEDWTFLWTEESLTVTANTGDYVTNPLLRAVNEDAVYFTPTGDSQYRLYPMEYHDYRADRTSYTTAGTPAYFTILPSGVMRLLPTPDTNGTLDLEGHLAAEALTNDADVPVIPATHHMTIVWRACMYWAAFNEATELLNSVAANYGMALLDLEAQCLPTVERMHSRAEGVDIVVVPE